MQNSVLSSRIKHPMFFEEFFQMGLRDVDSPFLTPRSRRWGAHLPLRAAFFAAFLLALAYTASFFAPALPLSHFFLIGVYFLAGIPSLIESIEDLASFQINIDVLMTLAAFGSVVIGSPLEGGLLLVLFSLSGAMEDAVTSKAQGAISSLHKLSPSKATVVEGSGIYIERALREIGVGTLILVKSGEVIPLDGDVVQGISSVNLVHITGENFPVTKRIGDSVPAGAMNLEGALTIRVAHTSSDSTLARIIKLVTQAQEAQPKLQRWFDALSKRYATTIITLAILFAAALPFIWTMPFLGHGGSIYRALAFLIAASPCALIISIPIAYLSAVSICAKKGILLKGGVILDALASCSIIAFDKTGTLTTGELTCLDMVALDLASPQDAEQALAAAYAMEINAVHPIAKAICNYAQSKNIKPCPIVDFRTIPGYGLEAKMDGQLIYIGHWEYILPKLSPQKAAALQKIVESYKDQGELLAVLLLAEAVYVFRFRDTLRPHMKETLDALRKESGMRLLMLTGDNVESAKKIAQEMSITEFHANLRPEDKLRIVGELSEKHGLAMVGDGINDAPALARATVGIGMGKVGSGAAIDAADVVLLHDNIERLNWLLQKSFQTERVVRQNLILATAVIFAASIPALGGFVPLWLAVVVHEGGTVLVGLNGLRLLKG